MPTPGKGEYLHIPLQVFYGVVMSFRLGLTAGQDAQSALCLKTLPARFGWCEWRFA